jgi:hypothetical protein
MTEAAMYVILANKSGHFRTEPGEGMEPVESYDYVFYGRRIAHYVIARMAHDAKVRIVDESGADTVNLVPSKFLPRFDTLDGARAELAQLAKFGSMDIALVKV